MELDENLFKEESNIFYEDKSIYTIQYYNGGNAAVSYGLINNIGNLNIQHTCSTDKGSSGSPLLNISNNKVIGIHKEGSTKFNFNRATLLKFPLNDFIKKIQNKHIGNNNSNNNDGNYMNNNSTNVNSLKYNDYKKPYDENNYLKATKQNSIMNNLNNLNLDSYTKKKIFDWDYSGSYTLSLSLNRTVKELKEIIFIDTKSVIPTTAF